MSKTFLFLIGILVFAVAAGGMWYRIAGDPGAGQRYDWALEQIGVRQQTAAPIDAEDARDRTSAASPKTANAERSAKRQERRQEREQTELFKLGLDLANLLVGLIGIYLAVSSMRGRSESRS